MSTLTVNNREVTVHMGGINLDDYPDFCDAYIESAYWEDTDEDLTEEELNKLNKLYEDYTHELVINQIF